MNEIAMYVTMGLIGIICLVILIINIVTFCGLSKEQKKEILKTYLKGLFEIAIEEFGDEILENVENFEKYFKENAPVFYKILILFIGKDSFVELVNDIFSEYDK